MSYWLHENKPSGVAAERTFTRYWEKSGHESTALSGTGTVTIRSI